MSKHHYQITMKDLLDSNLIPQGEEVTFKEEKGFVSDNGNIFYQGKEYTSLSNWAKEVAAKKGLSKHYNGWKVVYCKGRPLDLYREEYLTQSQNVEDESERESSPKESRKRKRSEGGTNLVKKRRIDSSSHIVCEDEMKISCTQPLCSLCITGPPAYFKETPPTWADILQVVLFSLAKNFPDRQYFSLSNDIYPFVHSHLRVLGCEKHIGANWKQTVKMTLSHARYAHLFENGYDLYLKTGFWRIKLPINPYKTSYPRSKDEGSKQDTRVSVTKRRRSVGQCTPSLPPFKRQEDLSSNGTMLDALDLSVIEKNNILAERNIQQQVEVGSVHKKNDIKDLVEKDVQVQDVNITKEVLADMFTQNICTANGVEVDNTKKDLDGNKFSQLIRENFRLRLELDESNKARSLLKDQYMCKCSEYKDVIERYYTTRTLNDHIKKQATILSQETITQASIIDQLRNENDILKRTVGASLNYNGLLDSFRNVDEKSKSNFELCRLYKLVSELSQENNRLRNVQVIHSEASTTNTVPSSPPTPLQCDNIKKEPNQKIDPVIFMNNI